MSFALRRQRVLLLELVLQIVEGRGGGSGVGGVSSDAPGPATPAHVQDAHVKDAHVQDAHVCVYVKRKGSG